MRGIIALAGLLVCPRILLAANPRPDAAFKSDGFAGALKELFGTAEVTMSDRVELTVPDIAENGAVVPLGVKSDLESIDTIAIFIKENPNPLTASFDLAPNALADISTRAKMGKSTAVLAVVRSEDKLYGSEKEVKVTIGGCGG